MRIADLLHRLRALDVQLVLEGDALRINAPRGVVDPALMAAIRDSKGALVEWLRSAATAGGAGADAIPATRRDGDLPLSFGQARLWFLEQLAPGNAAYNVALNVLIEGPLDVAALATALRRLVERHESLRTRFESVGRDVRQVPVDGFALTLAHTDLTGEPGAAGDAALARLAHDEASASFDLGRDPPIRARLVRVAADRHHLLLTLHHIVFDGWSRGVLFDDLTALYEAAVTGAAPALDPLSIQYADYAAWQRRWIEGDGAAAQLRYWSEQLRGCPTLELPTDRRRPDRPTFAGDAVTVDVSPELLRELESLARAEGATLFMVLLAAFFALLGRYSGQDDLVVGSPVANRPRAELEPLIGFFVNMLVMRADLSSDPTPRELIAQVSRTALDAFANQDLPFERMVEALDPERDLSRNPLFQVVLALHNAADGRRQAAGLTFGDEPPGALNARFDLEVHAHHWGDRLGIAYVYATDLFEAATIRRLLEHYRAMLAGFVREPDRPLHAISILEPAERRHLLVELNQTRREVGAPLLVPAAIARQAEARPHATAVEMGATRFDYRQLDAAADALAARLRGSGVGRDVPVAVLSGRTPEVVVAWLAVMKAGGAYVPLDPAHPSDRIAYMLSDCGAPVLLCQRALVAAGEGFGGETLLLEDVCASGAPVGRVTAAWTPPAADDLAYIIYTSGSTGRPKGVAITHAGLANLVCWHNRVYAIGPEDRASQIAGLGFDAAVWEVWPYLVAGASVHLVEPWARVSPPALWDWLREREITHAFVPTPLAEALLRLPRPADLALRTLLTGGDRLHGIGDDPLPFRLVNHYGPTENTVVATFAEVTPGDPLPPIGRPIDNVRAYVLGTGLQPVPRGVPGELVLAGDSLARGYWRRTELTAERFVEVDLGDGLRERVYRTGDRVRWRADDTLEFLGRADEQVKIRGYRIELGEIESVLAEAPGVAEASVLCREDTPREKRLVAYVVPSPIDGESGELVPRLREHLRARLPDYMVPSAFVVLERIPLTPNGKVNRAALPAPDGAEAGVARVAPRTELERTLVEIFRDVLDVEEVGVHDDFFDIGGHSLLATQVTSRVRARLGVELALADLFRRPNAEALAAFLARDGAAAADVPARSTIPVVRRDGPLPLSFAQERLWFLAQLSPDSPAYHVSLVVALEGDVDLAALEGAVNAVVARHEALRTSFPMHGGRPSQAIADTLTIDLPQVDLRGLEPERLEDEVRRACDGLARRRFDLAAAPLLRATVIRTDAQRCVLALTMHHIVSDGWSVSVLMRELGECYAALSSGRAPRLDPLPIQYADFATWQRDWLSGDELERQVGYWRERLRDLPACELPADRLRPPTPTFRGASEIVTVPTAVVERLEAVAQAQGATLFMALLAAFGVLLRRYVEDDDIAIGSPIANRNRAEIEGLVGCFVNMLVFRLDLAGSPTYRELVTRVRDVALEAYAHQDVPFDKLVDELVPERDVSRNALFQVAFALQNAPPAQLELEGVRLAPVPFGARSTRFDLEVHALPGAHGLTIACIYSLDLFEGSTARGLLDQLESLLRAFAAQPDAGLDVASVRAAEARGRALDAWNATATDYPRDATIVELFRARAAEAAARTALAFDDAEMTYAELDARSDALAGWLRAHGVRRDVPVGVMMARSARMVVAWLGVLKAGGAYVPLDPEYPAERLAFMLDDTAAPVVLTERAWSARLDAFGGAKLSAEDWPQALAAGVEPSPGWMPPDASSLAYIVYTSGSTGVPKGVAIPHRGVVRLVRDTDYLQLGPDDVVVQGSSASFDAATFEVWGALLAGGRLVGVSRETALEPRRYAAFLRERGVTALFMTTALFNQMVREAPGCFTGVGTVLFGGEAVDVEAVRRALAVGGQRRLVHVYGPTESTTFASWYPIDAVPDRAVTVPIGAPIANTRLHVLDRQMGPVAVGVPGELYIGGDGLAREYWARPELTAERFVELAVEGRAPERLYRTGDRVRRRGDGAIEFLGRYDDQVKLRGFRIELGEVEAALRAHPGVSDAVVLCRPDASGEQALVAYVTRAREGLGAAALRDELRGRLPAYMVPAAFVFLAQMPVNANGKVDRRALPAPESERRVDDVYVAPRGEREARIAALWCEVLGLERVGVHDNFFDLGGNSLLVLRLRARLEEALAIDVPVVALFEHPTIAALADHVAGESTASAPLERGRARVMRWRGAGAATGAGSAAVAVVGMAGRFPGAADIESFWRDQRDGREGIRFFTRDELLAAGVDPRLVDHPSYVPARGLLDGAELFDAAFFGYTPREAEMMDPQQRVLLECAFEALESSGHDAARFEGLVGVYAGASESTYLYTLPASLVGEAGLGALLSGGRDFLATRISYKLDLRGPSMNVQTACSTSLVAVHEACRALAEHECDLALAGGVSIQASRVGGYLYEEEGIKSPDGHCRAFDASARGTVAGEGVGVVVLKRLAEALVDGDTIHAVIRGTAINNDGADKVGFTAPSVRGQAAAIGLAQAVAGVEPADVGYVEAHGTGTALGDPIEIAALGMVLGEGAAPRVRPCALGALKASIGHLDAAAGVAGLIRTVLMLEHRELLPTAHFRAPNPEIDFARHGIEVVAEGRQWEVEPGRRRIAGVSSFGMGGTNAHAVLEEAPEPAAADPAPRAEQLLVLSARTASALDAACERLADHLDRHPEVELADVAWTLQTGRREFPHRRALVARGGAETAAALRARDAAGGVAPDGAAPGVVFLFPGQGAQRVDMAKGLYHAEALFRREVDESAAVLTPVLGLDIRTLLYPRPDDAEAAGARLVETRLAQPALFVIEHALARLWMSWGVEPVAMVGHSIGELVAACIAGVMSRDDALRLVAERGRLMGEMQPGAMLAVSLAEDEVSALLGDGLWLAGVNGPRQCVVSGHVEAVEAMAARLAERDVACTRLRTSHAFHSGMMDPALERFARFVGAIELRPPQRPYLSNVTGDWIRAEEATSPDYYARHLRQPVRFADALARLLEGERRVLLETGPGRVLGTLARAHPSHAGAVAVVSSLDADGGDAHHALGRLWVAGVRPDWLAYHGGTRRRRIPLPTYPFERRRFWPSHAARSAAPAPRRRADPADWFHVPGWEREPLAAMPAVAEASAEAPVWLIVADAAGDAAGMGRRLAGEGARVVAVTVGDRVGRDSADAFVVRPGVAADMRAVVQALVDEGAWPTRVVHLRGLTDGRALTTEDARARCFYEPLHLMQALGEHPERAPVRVVLATDNLHEVIGTEAPRYEKALVVGPGRVAPLESAQVTCTCIDFETLPGADLAVERADAIRAELAAGLPARVVAHRRGHRWVPAVRAVRVPTAPETVPELRAGGTYLVTGGLGGIGRALARHLVTDLAARVVLVGRTALPAEHEWDDWLAAHAEDDPVARRIRVVRELRGRGGQVEVLAADVADRAAMERVFASVAERFGALDGVIHAAGVPGAGLIALKTAEVAEAVLRPKVEGTLVLAELAARAGAGFLLLCSSQTAVKGAAGQVDYTAANAFQDAFALGRRGDRVPRVVAVNWDTWREGGMAVDTVLPAEYAATRSSRLALGLSDDEGWEVTRRVLATGWPQVLVSTCEFPPPAAAAPALEPPDDASEAAATPGGHERPELEADYVAPSGPVETAVAALWGALFGIDRVGANDDFFELGGHSLLATQLVNRLKQEFPDAVLSLRALYDSPTVAGLAARIAAAAPAPRAAPRTRLAAAVPSERAAILAEYVREQAAEAAGAAVPADDDLRALDLSTLVPGLIWAFKRDLELSVYPREILRDPSVGAIAEILRRALFDTGGHSTGADTRAGGSAASARSRAPVAVAVSERLPAAAFVLSAPRSGSTLLRLMLSRHRGLFSPPELGLMNVASAGEWLGALGRVVDVDGLGRDLAALARLDPATCVSELRALARDDAPVERVYRTLQRWAGERLLVDKTPSYAMNAAVLERADAMFDGARFVHLVRHPYAMIESFVRHRMAHLLEDDPGDPQAVAEHWWTTCNENLVALADRLGPQRVHRVRYEDLVREPEPVMREMCRFLDVEFDPAVLDPYARGAVIGGVGDPDILQHDGVDPRLADAWERVELARPVDPRTAALAARFDYTLPGNDSDAGSDDALLARLDRMSAEEIDALFQQTFDGSGDDDRR